MATFSLNTTIKISGAASASQVLSSTQYAIASYVANYGGSGQPVFEAYFGPGQTVASLYNTGGAGQNHVFSSGVVFENSP